MKRRHFLTGALATAALPAIARAPDAYRPSAEPTGKGLAALARRTGRFFGCAVKSRQLAEDAPFVAAVVREADMVVQEYELKRKTTQPAPGRYDFSGADKIIDFATRHGMRARGHALVWYAANPPWIGAALAEANDAQKVALLTGYIDTAMPRYAGRIQQWDVVNEPLEPREGRADGMREENIWSQALGERYIDTAFHTARAADAQAMLFLTDFGLEHDSLRCERRRIAMLKLLDRLMARKVPIDAIGIQGHLKPFRESFDQKIFADFLDRLRGYGLKIAITEFDIADRGGSPDPQKRDAEVAAVGRAFLDVALASPAVGSILCWGLSDRYSWLSSYKDYQWPDGQLSRGLPLDSQLHRKPLWSAIAGAFEAA